jgi:hypothetical protein
MCHINDADEHTLDEWTKQVIENNGSEDNILPKLEFEKVLPHWNQEKQSY